MEVSKKRQYKQNNFRKVLFINPRFQIMFLLFMFALLLVTALSFYLANYMFFLKFQGIGKSIGLESNHIFFKFIQEQQHSMNIIFLVTVVLVTFLMGFLGLVFSNWIAGPLYRLNRHMLEIAQGNPVRPVNFRKKDFFLELAESFNLMIVRLNNGNAVVLDDNNTKSEDNLPKTSGTN